MNQEKQKDLAMIMTGNKVSIIELTEGFLPLANTLLPGTYAYWIQYKRWYTIGKGRKYTNRWMMVERQDVPLQFIAAALIAS